jgi:O-acetyl-ADP-ribose deacetylase (regulator of RNase III)
VIEVRLGELADADAVAILRPVSADWTAVTAATRRLELKAGEAVAEQCRRLGELPVGSAAITPAGGLTAQFLVHVVVRSLDEPVSPASVRRSLQNGLRRLSEWAVDTVAMPPLGTGAGNLDAEEAAAAMLPVITEHAAEHDFPKRVHVLVENEYELQVFEAALEKQRGTE